MLNGYRTYLSGLAILIIQALNMLGFTGVTGEQLGDALTMIATVGVFIFRYLAKPKA